MPEAPRIDLVREGPIVVLFLDHPPENRLTQAMIHELSAHVAALEKDTAALAVVVAGAGGRTFCEGPDLEEWSGLSAKDAQTALQRGFEAFWALEHLSKPTIAAVEGSCKSVGAELALACDLRFASESATFAFPEIDRAWMPSHGGTARLPRMVGRAKALELFLSAANVDAREAAALGFVEHVTKKGEAMTKAIALARSFAEEPRAAVHAIKRALTEGEEKPYRNRFLLEAQYAVQLLWTDAYREAQEKVRRKGA
ncbi:MAG TPA: enoyl-CoA hydratase/isomerase family protein [Thermoplasmata archaeon]|nr:enoyl-CoA hydratase/isomerase family protein [Thermoplasmata archaeon]